MSHTRGVCKQMARISLPPFSACEEKEGVFCKNMARDHGKTAKDAS
jgi:hypothetical protein